MDKIGDKFSLYDFIGFLFPGLTLLFIIYLLAKVFGYDMTTFGPMGSGEKILFYTIAGYIVGHFVQAYGNKFEEHENSKKYEGAKYFSKYLVEKCKSKEYVNQFLQKASQYFGLREEGNEQILFRYAYKFLLVNNIGGEYKTFNYLYSFYRGMAVSLIFSGILTCFCLFIQVIDCFTGILNITSIQSICILTISILLQKLLFAKFKERFFRFGEYFTNEVISCFSIYLCKKSDGGV